MSALGQKWTSPSEKPVGSSPKRLRLDKLCITVIRGRQRLVLACFLTPGQQPGDKGAFRRSRTGNQALIHRNVIQIAESILQSFQRRHEFLLPSHGFFVSKQSTEKLGRVAQVERADEGNETETMEVEGVCRVVSGLIRATETKNIGCDNAAARREKVWNHTPIEVSPGRLAVQAEKYRRRCWSLVEIGHRQTAEARQIIDAVRAPGTAGQIGKTFLRGSQDLGHSFTRSDALGIAFFPVASCVGDQIRIRHQPQEVKGALGVPLNLLITAAR